MKLLSKYSSASRWRGLLLLALLAPASLALAAVGSKQQALLDHYANGANIGFSAERGKAFFLARHAGGEADTPSCSTCHTSNPAQPGRTRAGKDIAPMAVSQSPNRFGDLAKAEKWFLRNCSSVLGRECTAQEKGDFITFMASQ